MITCLKSYNKLYNKRINLDLNKKELQAAAKRCSENGYCVNYEKNFVKNNCEEIHFFFTGTFEGF